MSAHRNLTANLLRVYRRATPEEVAAGLAWYDRAFTECERMAFYTGRTVSQAATVLSHLSPRVTYQQSLQLTLAALAGQPKPSFALTRSWERAMLAVGSDDPLSTFGRSAYKTSAFAKAILGERTAVVVDIWTARAAGASEFSIRSSSGYQAVVDAFRRGALRVGLSARDLQAITWCHARGAHD